MTKGMNNGLAVKPVGHSLLTQQEGAIVVDRYGRSVHFRVGNLVQRVIDCIELQVKLDQQRAPLLHPFEPFRLVSKVLRTLIFITRFDYWPICRLMSIPRTRTKRLKHSARPDFRSLLVIQMYLGVRNSGWIFYCKILRPFWHPKL